MNIFSKREKKGHEFQIWKYMSFIGDPQIEAHLYVSNHTMYVWMDYESKQNTVKKTMKHGLISLILDLLDGAS